MNPENKSFQTYSGSDELEVMRFAENYNASLLRIIGSQIGDKKKILDFGAGNGLFASLVEKNYGLTPDCLEPDPFLAEKIKASLHANVISSINGIPDESYDLIYSLNVLEHIENDQETLEQLKKKLTPGGVMLIYVPAFMILYSSNDRRVGHFRRYTKKSMSALFNERDLKCLSLEYFDPIGFLAALVYKILPGNDEGTLSANSIKVFDRFIFPINIILNPLTKKLFGKNLIAIYYSTGNQE